MNLQPPKAKDRTVVLHEWLRTAVALHTQNNFTEAELYYLAILKSQPIHFHALHMLGVLRRQQKRHVEAVKLLRQAVKLNANAAGLHSDLGTTLGEIERFQDALGSYDRSIALEPNNAATHNDRAAMLFKLNRFEEAITGFGRAIALNPRYPEAFYNLSAALKELSRLDEALTTIDAAIASRPNYADAHNMRGLLLMDLRRDDYGLEAFERALAIHPNHIDAIVNRGVCVFELGRAEEALSIFEKALLIDHAHVEAHFSYGNALAELKRTGEAIAAYDRALQLSPGLAKAEFNRARQFLLLGDLTEGWQGHERRFEQPRASRRWRTGPSPLWTGQPIAGKRIIVYDEQGIGDVIQFARYVPLLAELGADVTFLALPKIHRLLRSLPHSVRLIDREPTESFDFQCQLMSLPKAFKTTLATIPNAVPYLWPEPSVVELWRRRLGERDLKVGIVWQGNPAGVIDIGRSIPLRCYEPLAAIPGVRLISLQKNYGLDQLADLPPGMRVETLEPGFDDGPDAFVDTAAVMANLDLIITCDTSIAHLAGALGRPVWVALKAVPDWRWLFDRDDSPWYSTMRLYRQSTRGSWEDAVMRMAADLAGFRA